MASSVLKPLALAFALIAGASVQTLALAAEVDGPGELKSAFRRRDRRKNWCCEPLR